MDLLCFLLSGKPANGTLTAEIGFMFDDWFRPNAMLEFPIGGSGAIVDCLVGTPSITITPSPKHPFLADVGRRSHHFSGSKAPVESIGASPPHSPSEVWLAHPADTSRPNLADALGLLSRWRLSKPFDLQFVRGRQPLNLFDAQSGSGASERTRVEQWADERECACFSSALAHEPPRECPGPNVF
jgi:hypothetical protein